MLDDLYNKHNLYKKSESEIRVLLGDDEKNGICVSAKLCVDEQLKSLEVMPKYNIYYIQNQPHLIGVYYKYLVIIYDENEIVTK